MVSLAAWICGLVFGLGLLVSGMTDPAKVLGFLDVAGPWDPSLACVMGAALAVALPAFRLAKARDTSLFGAPVMLPTATSIDRPLLLGAALFGIGWGLVGLCPGPALVALVTGGAKAWIFGLAMFAGMAAHEAWRHRVSTRRTDAQAASG
jgi:uncharacterized membrane protein YedE/YeeE